MLDRIPCIMLNFTMILFLTANELIMLLLGTVVHVD